MEYKEYKEYKGDESKNMYYVPFEERCSVTVFNKTGIQ